MPITLPPMSRRQFLSGLVATAGALGCADWLLANDAGRTAVDHIALLSDLHVAADKATVHKTQISMYDHLQKVVAQVLALPEMPSSVLVNGDCAYNLGLSEDYASVLEGLLPLRQAGLPIHLTLGNHDHRDNMLKALPADDLVDALPQRRVSVVKFNHADWYLLDTLNQTNTTPGVLGGEQLQWLAKSLDAKPDRPAVVMLHHQPDKREPEKRSGLTDTAEFMAVVLPRKQVKAVLFGHTHVWSHVEEEGLHFINLPTTAYVFDPAQPAGWVDAVQLADGLTIQLHAITPNHPADKQRLELKYR